MLAELTHRCPLQCPYCSNPIDLERKSAELSTEEWARVFSEAGKLGILQIHLSGGEPTSRSDIVELVKAAYDAGLYTNLITAGVTLGEAKLDALLDAGLDHVQISLEDTDPAENDRIGNYKGGHQKKLTLARLVRDRKAPLTINAVIHRHNIQNVAAYIDLALELDAARIEIAHTQYYGWALKNRAALMPTEEQARAAHELVLQKRVELKGRLVIDAVLPDYYARFPKPCMGGWGRTALAITPSGKVMPCHAADTIPGLVFDNVRDKSLTEIWETSPAFAAYRGTDWMEEPCRTCDRRELDWGGCRCQAYAMTGRAEATDPACSRAEQHGEMAALAASEAAKAPPPFIYRRIGGK
jgi:pyrroloquinoline quinone biosynthesis protein E